MTAAQALPQPLPRQTSGLQLKSLPPVLEAQGMSKRFGALVALEDVSFRLSPGSFHALLGENGAGKSTLVKCMMGFYRPDSGRVLLGDSQVAIQSPRDAQRQKIGMVYQHFTLVENMTVEENLVLARADMPKVIDWRRERRDIEAFMDGMPFRVAPGRLVRQLAAGEKQKLEILKQLYLGSRIIILDEPTSVLTPGEADEVLGMLRSMAHEGKLSVAMITHKFREVMQFSDVVSVLRKGRFVGGGSTADLSPSELGTLMVGAEPPSAQLERTRIAAREPALRIEGLAANDDLGLPVLENVNLAVRAGEILGIAGVSGNGQDELVEVLAGQRPLTAGTLLVGGRPFRSTRGNLHAQSVRLLPEAPLRNACVASMSVEENLAFRAFDQPPFAALRWLLRRRFLRAHAREKIDAFRVKTPTPSTPIGELSGGNVQRAVLARELSGNVSILIAANPCFGLDFHAVSEIRTRIMAARNAGAAVLLVSADLEEVFALSDRILVMSEGKIVHETEIGTADLAEIGRRMAGHHE